MTWLDILSYRKDAASFEAAFAVYRHRWIEVLEYEVNKQ